jgi:hypothetical protein
MKTLRSVRDLGGAFLGLAWLAAVAPAQQLNLESISTSGGVGNLGSGYPTITADGTQVAFESFATNLVASDTNGKEDIFVRDRVNGVTELISVDSAGVQADRDCFGAFISADGRFVTFTSRATNLVTGDTNGKLDVFVRDRQNGTTDRVSLRSNGVQGNGDSLARGISSDGNIVLFESVATNLVTGDTNAVEDVFLHDRTTGKTTRISVDSFGTESNGDSWYSCMSTDAHYVYYNSIASNLISSDTNGVYDVFVYDTTTFLTDRISVDSAGNEGDNLSVRPFTSRDGRYCIFTSLATNLVGNDSNGIQDVFLHDVQTGATDRVSLDSTGGEANGASSFGAVSLDGKTVEFDSDATNLVTGDTNSHTDSFIKDLTSGAVQRISVDNSGNESDGNSVLASMSDDASITSFMSLGDNLVSNDTNADYDVFSHTRCSALANSYNYGSGFPGTHGIPQFYALTLPSFGQVCSLWVDNSYGLQTTGLLFVGLSRAQIHASFGGDLLVLPFLTVLLPIPAAGLQIDGTIPNDDALCGLVVDLQFFESDPGAVKKISSTPGLELVLGN